MTYREQLNKLEKLGISVTSIEVANSCDSLFEFDYTDKEFEQAVFVRRKNVFESRRHNNRCDRNVHQ